jgi:predicted transglutaminase-like cysteine proteinase
MRNRFFCGLLALAFVPAVAVAAPPMPLGSTVAAPLGFTELCQRQPTECVDDATGGADRTAELAAVAQWAGQARWATLFGHTANDISEAPASAFPGSAARPQTPRSVSSLFSEGVFTPAATDADANAATDSVSPVEVTAQAAVSELSVHELQRVNSRVNRSIRRSEDYQTYGRADYWAAGSDNVKRGDCEDYVLAKRRALIEAGTPGQALSIAIVRTRQGEMHAVLLVATVEGEMVLDNLSPWVLPWNEAPYQWLDRQAPGAPTQWVRVGLGARS